MARISFNERDLSWYYRQRRRGQLSILMPGVSTFGPYEPVLVNSDNFVATLGDVSVDSRDLSYQMAASFVKAGADVLFWRIPLEGSTEASVTVKNKVDEDKGEQPQDVLVIKAKYAGSYGNKIKLKVVQAGLNYRVIVYNSTDNSLLDNFMVNFSDYNNEYFYQTVNQGSIYVEFEVLNGDVVTGTLDTEGGQFSLSGGTDGTYSETSVSDYLADSESGSREIFGDLSDILSYDFNIIINSGYNSYNRRIDTAELVSHGDNYTVSTVELIGSLVNITYNGESVDGAVVSESGTLTIPKASIPSAKDKDQVVVTYIIKGEIPTVISQVDDKFIALAESRGTAIYLVDGSKSWTAEEFYTYTGLPSDSTDRAPVLKSSAGFNTSYAAAFGPWCSATLASTGVTRQLPGSYVLLMSWANSLAAGTPMYYAPAGVKRASLNFVSSTEYQVGSAILDLWQNQDITTTDSHKINPITKLRQYGYVIYGNSTLLKNSASGATSMLQSLSVRVLANMIKLQAFDISLGLQFDQISDDLFLEFKTLLTDYMDQLKYSGALYSYQILAGRSQTTLDDLNSKTVPVIIRISPNPAAENFDITLEISQAGVDFDESTYENE